MINKNRLLETFNYLVGIDSVSKEEGLICQAIKKILESMGAEIFVDRAGEKIGSNTGNLIARFKGNTNCPPLLLNAHMDTVNPGKGISVIFKDRVITSDGTTILGADDKSAIAIIIETIRILQEDNLKYGNLEIVFTICEEIGLLGAKNLDYSLLTANYGYTLDATDTEGIVTQAPAANRIEIQIIGKDAHAGAEPEKGINAIFLASKAIAALSIGRVDHETTCNIGIIEGGTATNIVPSRVKIKGEARSHNKEKLSKLTDNIITSFKNVIDNYKKSFLDDPLPKVDFSVEEDFPLIKIPDNSVVVSIANKAAKNLGRKMTSKKSGGGSDANIFFDNGIKIGILGTGMRDIHTVRESIKLDDMVSTLELLLEIIKIHSKGL